MEENTPSKVGTFLSSAMHKFISIIMVLVIIALVGLVAWFWHNNELLEQRTNDLQDQMNKFEEMNDQAKVRDVVIKEGVRNDENVKNSIQEGSQNSSSKNDTVIATENNNKMEKIVLPEGSFKKVNYGYEGDFYIKGYAKIENRKNRGGVTQKEVPFFVTDYGKINDFKKKFGFDEFYNKEYGYLLGCLEENKIVYNSAREDEFYSKELTNNVLDSSIENQIILHVETYALETGGGAPDCYSKFDKVEIYQK